MASAAQDRRRNTAKELDLSVVCILIYLLRLETLLLLLALLLMLLLRSDMGERFFGDGERSAFPAGDRSRLPFASGSGLDMLAPTFVRRAFEIYIQLV